MYRSYFLQMINVYEMKIRIDINASYDTFSGECFNLYNELYSTNKFIPLDQSLVKSYAKKKLSIMDFIFDDPHDITNKKMTEKIYIYNKFMTELKLASNDMKIKMIKKLTDAKSKFLVYKQFEETYDKNHEKLFDLWNYKSLDENNQNDQTSQNDQNKKSCAKSIHLGSAIIFDLYELNYNSEYIQMQNIKDMLTHENISRYIVFEMDIDQKKKINISNSKRQKIKQLIELCCDLNINLSQENFIEFEKSISNIEIIYGNRNYIFCLINEHDNCDDKISYEVVNANLMNIDICI